MASVVDVLRESPSEKLLLLCTKEQLLQIKIEIAYKDKSLKETLRNIQKSSLIDLGVLEMPIENTSVAEEIFDPSLCAQAICLRELAPKEKQLELLRCQIRVTKM